MNNKGWGYTTMIILLALLFICGIVAIVYLSQLYSAIEGATI